MERALRTPDKNPPESEAEIPPPTGTLFVMSLYLLALSATWVALFMGLIAR